ncbi:MAG: MerR family transcriptional regulator [Acidimicrobiia bacterium]|nr:MerR family transcriptional regulator [Acidimicrobiia bacterium]MYC58531.1 MerR family transcriptional regulator [Acidimicrobiia bacterium]MYI30362.1 MerR family transcriptional regulator [Acidimicrobiia bacterium]
MTVYKKVASDFSSVQTIAIVGITYRQLDYWTRTGLVTSTAQKAIGSGSRRRYSYRDLLELKLIKRLMDEGIGLQRVREVFDYVRHELGEDLVSADLVIKGKKSLLVRTDEQLLDALRQGQGALYLPMDDLVQQVDAAVQKLPVEAAGDRSNIKGVASNDSFRINQQPASQTGS